MQAKVAVDWERGLKATEGVTYSEIAFAQGALVSTKLLFYKTYLS